MAAAIDPGPRGYGFDADLVDRERPLDRRNRHRSQEVDMAPLLGFALAPHFSASSLETSPMADDLRLRNAYHESGHVVAAVTYGIPNPAGDDSRMIRRICTRSLSHRRRQSSAGGYRDALPLRTSGRGVVLRGDSPTAATASILKWRAGFCRESSTRCYDCLSLLCRPRFVKRRYLKS
jgi:hypothetical protein